VLLGVDGVSDFNGLHSRRRDHEVEFYAFDMLVSEGEHLRKLPLSMRKTNLARPLARRVEASILAPFEQGEIGPDLFRHACLMGLEGLVSPLTRMNRNRWAHRQCRGFILTPVLQRHTLRSKMRWRLPVGRSRCEPIRCRRDRASLQLHVRAGCERVW
jgi:hypothetical protein